VLMESIVFNYLRNYREKYNIDDLKKEILSKGYSEIEFDDALNELKKNDLMSGGRNNCESFVLSLVATIISYGVVDR